ncbi:4-(cytidine 5'-diphospho)-2-C-methyl-D-erythritol kinase [Plebeiibacterium marinum]|uniref:4-diphosphocytidyl-2-C-methyl-D-erythritol kinase n=1 Tax=Plebeiibacterium marinum TaxID=2992111 RepID=A0AAE3MCX5_9BACT|nr:4-(cytidine 5'-diphospho)-2-C-methyl-D-erythritol kinase [Plebeiobacterium marinum]MCW3805468.1 4-(cytidine 5'-diphospho)-2-C-methyl-D-erythritol kinase [Plebeiobacterium marinum]
MICFPNAKINIGLNITEKRPDGYHNLETLFYPTKLYDVLEIIENKHSSDPYQWSSSGILIDGKAEDNLCIKALNLLKQDFNIPPLKIHLHKVIPFGAGLGGGSADAAFTLTALNEMFNLKIPTKELIKYASKIGADCAFFILNTPCIATGIGDILTPTALNLKGKYLVLVKPDIHISTPEAYSGISPKIPETNLLKNLQAPVNQWKNTIVNDFENSVFPNHPEIQSIKDKFYGSGAEYAAMTGSGAAVFGIFDNKPEINFPEYFSWQEEL